MPSQPPTMNPSESVPSTSVTGAPTESAAGPIAQSEPDPDVSNPDSARSGRTKQRLTRPPLGTRKSSGTIIIPRDSPTVEIPYEQYDEDDARAMSPRRQGKELQKMEDDARKALEDQANTLQSNLMEMIERVDSVKSEHEKLESGNTFLQSYIGELMQTSKITSAGAGKPKGKGRAVK